MRGLAFDVVHIINRRANILRNDIAALQTFDKTPERMKERRALVICRVSDNDAFAAAGRKLGQGVLVAHGVRQAEHIGDRFTLIVIRPHAAAAERRAKLGAVNGDDGAQAAIPIATE